MNTGRKLILIVVLSLALLMSSCGPGRSFGAALTPTLTITQASSFTNTLTSPSTNTPLPTPAPAAVLPPWIRPADKMAMVYVPEGPFTMGSDDSGYSDETPAHPVFLDAFWIDQTEVTNKMYALCVAAGKCDPPKFKNSYTHSNYFNAAEFADYPVVYVSWNDAGAYCGWAGDAGHAVRLPTEAEWEKAARGTDGRTYPWGEGNKCQQANFDGCIGDTARVASYETGKSPYGAYDLTGNVWEWVGDWYSDTYYNTLHNGVVDPLGPVSGTVRSLRGGAWWSSIYVGPAFRHGYSPDYAGDGLGFRCSRSAAPALVTTPPPECHQSGTKKTDAVFFPETGETHGFLVYLPPCYAENRDSAYPVLYWTSAGGGGIFDTVDSLIRQGDTPPFIAISVDISPNKGYGADAQIVNDVVPYIDSHYRTQADRLHRSITGFSHGAAIAVRAAFQAPDIFGRVAALSGGIADGEQEKFTGWISAMPPDQRPAVLIDVGEQDGVIVLSHHLTDLLDKLSFPYTFIQDPGNHHTEYSDSHFPDYLKWLIVAH